MSAKRDALLPRAHVVRTPSRESLAVHPLLNPPDSAKYVPYTPRQRQPTTTTSTPVPPSAPQGSVPAKSPLASLRAAAQAIGLDPNSLGWAILDKISYEGDASDEWSEIWFALAKSRAVLLLPSEPGSSHDAITPELVQDHVVLCDLASRDDTALITLSGLRGRLVHDVITFRSTLHRSTKPFQTLWTHPPSLDALAPLPVHPPESSYPSTAVVDFSPTLPLPARATKPPLPPRPGSRGTSVPSSARLSMPFASLFGQRPSTPPPRPSTPTPPPPPPPPPVPPTSDIDVPIDVAAFVVPTPISRTEVATSITTTLKGEIAAALAAEPPWLVERVHAFALAWFPFVRVPPGKKKLQDIGGGANRIVYAVNAPGEEPEEVAERFQTFYRTIEDELRSGRARAEAEETSDAGEEADEGHVRDVLETVEATLCTLLYDRLFLLSTSDDASHNEALSSRIAALNMLDLGLEHLDIDLGDANRAEVDAVVRACGQTLAHLDSSARSPREKAVVLVEAHKIVVEGLSKVPPIRLKSLEDADKDSPTHPSASSDAAEHVGKTSLATDPSVQSPTIPAIRLSTSPDHASTVEAATPPPPSPVSGDVLLPILIFSVVKANPSRLVSHLLFIQRFRNQAFGGEESYCLINLMAVAEFLENVDLGALGLGESEKKVLSTADLTPIPIVRPPNASPTATTTTPPLLVRPGGGEDSEHLASLRGRVGQGVDVIAGSANKVISGVVDTSFGVLRAFLPGSQPATSRESSMTTTSGAPVSGSTGVGVASLTGGAVSSPTTGSVGPGANETTTDVAPWGRPMGLLRRETGFSIAGLTAALPGGTPRGQRGLAGEEGQRELVEVASRPASLRSHRSGRESDGEDAEHDGEEEDEEEEASESESGEDGDGEERGGEEGEGDARSIMSFESMLSGGRTKRPKALTSAPAPGTKTTRTGKRRLTDLTGRLTHGMAEMSRRVQGGDAHKVAAWGRLPPPNRRFVECTEQEIRVSEVGELLREYQGLVEAIRSAGGFQE